MVVSGKSFATTARFCGSTAPRTGGSAHRSSGVVWGKHTDAALAEAFQGDHTIDCSRGRPYLTGLAFPRALRPLDLAVDSSGGQRSSTEAQTVSG